MKTPPRQRLCGVFVAALIFSGCATGRTTQQPTPELQPETVIEASGDRVYDLLRHAFVESQPERVLALLDSVAVLLPQRFVPAPVAETAAAKRLTSLTRVTLERYHAILPQATTLSPNIPLVMLLDILPVSISADLSNHPHYREFKIRALAGLSDVPIDLTPEVMAYIQFFRTEGRDFFGRWLSRSTAYLPMIQTVFRNHGLPQDLAYKAMIESGFNPRAVSHANAVGMWQFMHHTGSRYGLKRNTWVDDRMEPKKATEAAAKHLKRLYNHFKDWRLVVAAYNCGQGRMDRAIKESKTQDFWNIDSLPKETRNHLPKFMAAIIITKDPAYFGFEDIAYQPSLTYDEVSLKEPVALRLAAECAGTTYTWMRQLNPELRRAYTPPTTRQKSYVLRVPRGSAEKFKTNYARVPAKKKIQIVDYTVRPGDTLSGIAYRFGVSQTALKDANGITDPRRLRSGRKISIPMHPELRVQLATLQQNNIDRAPDSKNYHHVTIVVRPGDSLWEIAKREGLTVSHLRAWNNLTTNRPIHPGDRLTLYLPKTGAESSTVYYTVRSGDTLWDIARAFDTSVEALKSWNDIQSPASLRTGARIRVREGEIAE